MVHYEANGSSIDISFEQGEVVSLKCNGKTISADVRLPLFSFRLRMPTCEAVEFNAHDAKLVSEQSGADFASAEYAFDKFDGLRATISVRFGGKDWAAWRMSVKNTTEGAVEWVDFPQIALKGENDERKASFYWPFNEGVQIDDINMREKGWQPYRETEFPGEGSYALFPGMVESQFVAYELDGGLYMAAYDEKRGIKNIDIVPLENCVRLKIRTYAGGEFGADYATDFDVVTTPFESGWIEAADMYRAWFEKHLPEGLKKLSENTELPRWYGDAPIVVSYPVRGLFDTDEITPNKLFPYENAMPFIDELARKTNARIMVLLMHWEGTAPWAPPFVWPPYGGEEALRTFIDKLHAHGHLIGVYLSGIGFTEKSNLMDYDCTKLIEEGGYKRDFVVSPEGEIVHSHICTAQRDGYDMCPMGKDTAEIAVGEARKIAQAGVDYAQILDQNHGGNPYFCYSREHGHAPAPGPWMTSAMQDILKQIRAAAPNMLLGCESAASEPFIPELLLSDNRYHLNYMNGMPVPMYAYVYHEYLNNFMGNQCCAHFWFKPCADSLAYRTAYSLAAGDLATLLITDDGRIMQCWCDQQFDILPDREGIINLLRNVMRLRRKSGKKYLHGGRMLRPHEVVGAGEHTFEMMMCRDTLTVPRVLTSRWQAADGSIAQLLINWTDENITVNVNGQEVSVSAQNAVLMEE